MMKRAINCAIVVGPIVVLTVLWATHSTTASQLASVPDFKKRIGAGKPTYIRFFMNT